jgi:2-(1,2-epoxy-1,2-dihydrophenyl)acetyl-CoA isomerase
MAVTTTIDEGVAEVVLDRPEVLNSLDASTVADLHGALDEAESARVLLIRGEGRGFSAGRDLSGAEPLTEDATAILRDLFNPLIARIANWRSPTVAAVHGPCLGVGFGIAMACDLVWCAQKTRIGSPFANIGAVLDSGGHAALLERVGPHRALELIYTGRLLDGAEAAAMGLVNGVVADDALLDTVRATARRIADGPVGSFAHSKALLRRMRDDRLAFADVLDAEAVAQGAVAGTPEYVEGMTAFLEKRTPRFRR